MGFCLTYIGSGWPDTSLSWCLGAQSSQYDSSANATIAANAVSWWDSATVLDFTQESCRGDTNIRIDWLPPNPDRPNTLGFAEALGADTVQLNITMYDDANMGPNGWNDPVQVLAHELGHALGLGHSEVGEALMYPQIRRTCSPIETPSANACRTPGLRLSQEEIDGIDRLYGSARATRPFFDSRRFEFQGEGPWTVTLPFPDGSTGLAALCLVDTFHPETESDGWRCTWEWDNSRREVTFEVSAFNHGVFGSEIAGTVVVLDTARVSVDAYPFSIDHSNFGAGWYSNSTTHLSGMRIPANAVTFVEVTTYEPSVPASPLGYVISRSATDSSADITTTGGGPNSILAGSVIVLQPLTGMDLGTHSDLVTAGDATDVSMAVSDDRALLIFAVMHQFNPLNPPRDHLFWTTTRPRFERSDLCSTSASCVWSQISVSGGESRSWVEYLTIYLQER